MTRSLCVSGEIHRRFEDFHLPSARCEQKTQSLDLQFSMKGARIEPNHFLESFDQVQKVLRAPLLDILFPFGTKL